MTGLEGGGLLRAQPTVDSEQRGAIGAGETRTVTQGQLSASGELWWQLTNGAWIRSDLVSESEGCASLEEGGESNFVPSGDEACVLTVLDTGANQFSEASLDSAVVASLGADEVLVATSYSPDLDGGTYGFWRLQGRGGTWVREDAVSESSACDTLRGTVGEGDAAAADACVVTGLEAGAVLRSGAGTEFESLGSIGEGESRTAMELVANDRGESWWRLTNGAFVLSTLVSESPECNAPAEVSTEAEGADPETSCVLTVLGTGANQFSEASLDSAVVASLGAGEMLVATSYSPDPDGGTYGFWRLQGRGGTWVREDAVSESPGCDALR